EVGQLRVAPASTILAGPQAPQEVALSGDLTWEADAHPCQAEVELNGVGLGRFDLKAGQGQFDYAVPVAKLRPRDNGLQVVLRNAWGARRAVPAPAVRYLRPPHSLVFQPARVGAERLVEITARVKSPADLPITPATVEAKVHQRPLPASAVTVQAAGP